MAAHYPDYCGAAAQAPAALRRPLSPLRDAESPPKSPDPALAARVRAATSPARRPRGYFGEEGGPLFPAEPADVAGLGPAARAYERHRGRSHGGKDGGKGGAAKDGAKDGGGKDGAAKDGGRPTRGGKENRGPGGSEGAWGLDAVKELPRPPEAPARTSGGAGLPDAGEAGDAGADAAAYRPPRQRRGSAPARTVLAGWDDQGWLDQWDGHPIRREQRDEAPSPPHLRAAPARYAEPPRYAGYDSDDAHEGDAAPARGRAVGVQTAGAARAVGVQTARTEGGAARAAAAQADCRVWVKLPADAPAQAHARAPGVPLTLG